MHSDYTPFSIRDFAISRIRSILADRLVDATSRTSKRVHQQNPSKYSFNFNSDFFPAIDF